MMNSILYGDEATTSLPLVSVPGFRLKPIEPTKMVVREDAVAAIPGTIVDVKTTSEQLLSLLPLSGLALLSFIL